MTIEIVKFVEDIPFMKDLSKLVKDVQLMKDHLKPSSCLVVSYALSAYSPFTLSTSVPVLFSGFHFELPSRYSVD